MRPGRLDRILYAGPPNFEARCDIFRIQLRRMSVDPIIDLEKLARVVSANHTQPGSKLMSDGLWTFRPKVARAQK